MGTFVAKAYVSDAKVTRVGVMLGFRFVHSDGKFPTKQKTGAACQRVKTVCERRETFHLVGTERKASLRRGRVDLKSASQATPTWGSSVTGSQPRGGASRSKQCAPAGCEAKRGSCHGGGGGTGGTGLFCAKVAQSWYRFLSISLYSYGRPVRGSERGKPGS
jgi:hypothetical protein